MQDMDKIIDELTLMLLYLTSWQECPTEGIRHKPIRTAREAPPDLEGPRPQRAEPVGCGGAGT